MRKRIPDELRDEIKEYAQAHGKVAASGHFNISISSVYAIFSDRKKSEEVLMPGRCEEIPAVLSNDYVLGLAKNIRNLRNLQPAEFFEVLALTPELLEELVDRRKKDEKKNVKPSELDSITVVRREGWQAKDW